MTILDIYHDPVVIRKILLRSIHLQFFTTKFMDSPLKTVDLAKYCNSHDMLVFPLVFHLIKFSDRV